MRSTTSLLTVSLALGSCYLSPEKHAAPQPTSFLDGGVAPGASDIDAQTEASDSAAEGGPADALVLSTFDAGCSSHLVCSASAPSCQDGTCSACRTSADCARFPATPACGPSGACVPCTAEQKLMCVGSTPVCDARANRCVQCNLDTDCGEERADCKPDHTCGLCSEDVDCARFGKVCNKGSGQCVECRPQSEEADCRSDQRCDPAQADCAGTSCDRTTFKCTQTLRGSLNTCRACQSDSECAPNHACVPLSFGASSTAQRLGGFCLKLRSAGCSEPYGMPIESRASVSEAAADTYCGINEARTSCAAITALLANRACSGDEQACAAPGALCRDVSAIAGRCTYACSNSRQCPLDTPCGGPAGATYCGGLPRIDQ